jgi:FtsP/CotA-like multicopper oxidase with cupredoxin domain
MRRNFKLNRMASAAMAVCAGLMATPQVNAGPGFGDAYDLNNVPFIIQSYFTNSPAGDRQWTKVAADGTTEVDANGVPILDPALGAPDGYAPENRLAFKAALIAKYGAAGAPVNSTGKALRKFVDTLPLPAGHALTTKFAANKTTLTGDPTAAKFIPVAVPKKWVNPQGVTTADDYYEIAAVEYSEKFHSDLRKATTLRGYVQIDHEASNGRTPLPGSKSYALKYPDGSTIFIAGTDANGKLTGSKVAALAVEKPHYLGPLLTASQHIPTRIKFHNLLPVGRAITTTDANGKLTVALDANGVPQRRGDIFLPLDPSVPGSGLGPDGLHTYSQNRVNMHLHGGDNPWISDGGPHTWITPAGEANAAVPGSIASLNPEPAAGPLDATLVPEFLRGPGAINVPDMNDPGAGAMTYYFPNGQSARMEWYHDHTVGVTRLNVYAGLVSAYFLTDAKEQDLIARKVIPGPDDTIPLILQDKTFVPDDIAWQDARWDTAAWGAPGDQWYPHVYETVQDPNQATNFNSVGRWHWGPWFWPSFPSAYNLPTGAYGDVTLTPEAWQDTSVVNGVAYPTITVEPKPYRLRVLNGSNDRTFSFNMFVADETVTTDDGRTNTEVKMVPVNSWVNTTCADAAATRSDGTCTPQTWSTDVYGHNGGVPDATTQGPTLYQIGSEGGLLPGVAAKDPTPLSFLLDKGRAAVLNVDFGASGLLIGNGERADIVVDFSAYAGKTLLVYNDNGAPVPAADPRNEFFTGYGDNSATGGSEDTKAGYGPNSRTIMQIVVAPAAVSPVTPLVVADLDTEIKTAYKAVQETPVVAQSAYNAALGTNWTDNQAFANIYTGSLKEPAFNFVPGTPSTTLNSVIVTNQGTGYVRKPTVTLQAAPVTGVTATAVASLKIDKLHVISGGAGYNVAPIVTIVSNAKGSGAAATTRLKVSNVQVTAGGSGYSTGAVTGVTVTNGGLYSPGISGIALGNAAANRYPGTQVPVVTISAPTVAGGVQATATATMTGAGNNRRVASITITNRGSGYSAAPTVTIAAATGTGTKVNATVGTVSTAIVAPTVTFPASAGTTATGSAVVNAATGAVTAVTLSNAGTSYVDFTPPVPTFTGGTVVTAAAATTTVSALPTVTFAAPLGTTGDGSGGTRATGVPIVSAAGVITGVTITNAGTGYTAAPSVTFSAGTTTARATSFGAVGELVLDTPDPTNPLGSSGGGGYEDLSTAASEPTNGTPGMNITFTAPPAAPVGAGFTSAAATAGATGRVFDITLSHPGQGYTATPTVTVAAPTALTGSPLIAATTFPVAATSTATAQGDLANNGTAKGSILVKTKAIQELFDPTYGRLNATFGVEIPYTSALTQTTIPLGYVDAPTEEFQDGETQIWKITHNGVDSHPIHFHLVNVQLINRVGWDNFVSPPELNELGWKETIKMSPLEDVIVAVRAKRPKLGGFGIPNSYRLLDPSQPVGAMTGFTQIDANTGLPAPMSNTWQDFGWEYVWHCHILGHEENDFMRPIIFRANEAVPAVADGLKLVGTTLSWTDNASSEFQYVVEQAATGTGAFIPVATATQSLLANSTRATVVAPPTGSAYRYRVTAIGQAGSATSAELLVNAAPPAAPTGLAAAARTVAAPAVVLTWTDNATTETSYTVERALASAPTTWTPLTTTLAANATTYTDSTAVDTGAYVYRVAAVNTFGTTYSNTVSVAAVQPAQALPAAPVLGANGVTINRLPNGNLLRASADTVTITWTAPVGGGAVATYTIQSCNNATCTAPTTLASGLTTTSYPAFNVSRVGNPTYRYRVLAVNATGAGPASAIRSVTAP